MCPQVFERHVFRLDANCQKTRSAAKYDETFSPAIIDRRGFARGADGAWWHLFIGTDASRCTASRFSRGGGFVELRRSDVGAAMSTSMASFRSLADHSGAPGRARYARRHARLPWSTA